MRIYKQWRPRFAPGPYGVMLGLGPNEPPHPPNSGNLLSRELPGI